MYSSFHEHTTSAANKGAGVIHVRGGGGEDVGGTHKKCRPVCKH